MEGAVLVTLFAIILWIIGVVIALAAFAFWIWMLIHAVQNNSLNNTEKIIWVIVIVFLHFLGALIYYFVGRQRTA